MAGIVSAFLILSTSGVASAESYSHSDGTRDMWVRTINQAENDPFVPAPSQIQGDITGVKINHNRRFVQLFMTVPDMAPSGEISNYSFYLQNGRRKSLWVHLPVRSTYPGGRLLLIGDGQSKPKCRGIKTFRINRDTGTVAVNLPRRCLGNPKFLRMRADAWADYGAADQTYTDDALSAEKSSTAWSPWVKRG